MKRLLPPLLPSPPSINSSTSLPGTRAFASAPFMVLCNLHWMNQSLQWCHFEHLFSQRKSFSFAVQLHAIFAFTSQKRKKKKKKKAFLLWFIYSNWYLYYPAVHCSTPIQASEGKWAEYIISYQNSLRNLVAIFSLQVFQVLRILHTSFYLKI